MNHENTKEGKMKYRKLLMSAVCLIMVFGLAQTVSAWWPYGYSELCFYGSARGPEGSVIVFTLKNADVYAKCCQKTGPGEIPDFDKCDQPGIGNLAGATVEANPEGDPTKGKGVVTIPLGTVCIPYSQFDQHWEGDYTDPNNPILEDTNGDGVIGIKPGHVHICHPTDNVNKFEKSHTAVSFDVEFDWTWYKNEEQTKKINWGNKKCKWNGGFDENGHATSAGFTCTETSAKPIKYVDPPE
jgi:hypothetical protein